MAHSFVAYLSHLTIGHASLPKRSGVDNILRDLNADVYEYSYTRYGIALRVYVGIRKPTSSFIKTRKLRRLHKEMCEAGSALR